MRNAAPAPGILHCRDLASVRTCLTYFRKVLSGASLDLRKVGFIDPGAIVLMHHHARLTRGRSIQLSLPQRKGPRDFFFGQVQSSITFRPGSANSYPLRFVRRESDLVPELAKWRQMLQASQALDEERAREFSSTIAEVLTNSFAHGLSKDPCIVAGQTFPKKQHSVLVVLDNGIGIPASLRNSKRYPGYRSDEEWILHALGKGITSRTRESNRGFGLYYLARMISENGGSLVIVSGMGAVSIRSGGAPRAEPLGYKYGSFDGTLMILDINSGSRS